MESYKIELRKSAVKELESLSNGKTRRQVAARIQSLLTNPKSARGVEKLSETNKFKDCYKIRQGNYRVVYTVDDEKKLVVIERIRHRKDAFGERLTKGLSKKMNNQPVCTIIAGPNGAGKTTFAMEFLPQTNCGIFLNADMIATALSPLGESEKQLLKAGKLFLQEVEDCIEKRENFAFETTLSGKAHLGGFTVCWLTAGA